MLRLPLTGSCICFLHPSCTVAQLPRLRSNPMQLTCCSSCFPGAAKAVSWRASRKSGGKGRSCLQLTGHAVSGWKAFRKLGCRGVGKAGRHPPVPFATQLALLLSAECWRLLLILLAVMTYKTRLLDPSCAPALDFGPLHVPGWLTRGPGGSDAGVPNLPAKSGMGMRLRCGLLAVCNKEFIGMTMQGLLGLKAC